MRLAVSPRPRRPATTAARTNGVRGSYSSKAAKFPRAWRPAALAALAAFLGFKAANFPRADFPAVLAVLAAFGR